MAPRARILVTPPNFDAAARDFLAANGCELAEPGAPEAALAPEELASLAAGCDGWIIGPQAFVTRALVDAAPRCRVFVRRGVGYERLNIGAIRESGRVAAIAAGGNDDSVADHVIGLMLAVTRRVREHQLAMLAGDWTIRVSGDLFGKTVGLIGLGRTARAVVRRLRGFEAKILATTPRPDAAFARAHAIVYVDLPELLARSDFVSLHAPLNDATRHLIGASALAAMKPGAILINAGRGGLVDDAALLACLRAGHLAGAGLDVFEGETDAAAKRIAMDLLALPNVVGTPHAAASTREGLARTNLIAAQCVVAALGERPLPPGCLVADGRAR